MFEYRIFNIYKYLIKFLSWILSSGRDKVLVLWDISQGTSLKILPVYEGIEGAFIIPSAVVLPNSLKNKKSEIYAACAGEKGKYFGVH